MTFIGKISLGCCHYTACVTVVRRLCDGGATLVWQSVARIVAESLGDERATVHILSEHLRYFNAWDLIIYYLNFIASQKNLQKWL